MSSQVNSDIKYMYTTVICQVGRDMSSLLYCDMSSIQLYVKYMIQEHVRQGGRKFEMSWEPNFPVNDFARNNGKNRVIIKTIINIKL